MKRAISLILCAILAISLLAACGDKKEEKVSEPFDWSVLELKEYLPEPKNVECELSVDRTDCLSFTIINVSKAEFKAYREECVAMGYTIDSEDTGTVYDAFNSEGYNVRFVIWDGEISVTLNAPEQMETFAWPTSGLGAMLPAAKSALGRISWDNSETFIIHIGETTLDDLSEYVTLCEDQGFNVNHSKSEGFYKAENAAGYALTINYLGFNTMEVALKAPEGGAVNETTQAPAETKPASNDEVDGDFKAAMDAYEEFIGEYVDIVKKFTENPSDLTILSSYSEYVGKYATFVADFEKWENEDLNAAELAYYAEVQARVTKKLLEVAQ